MTDLAPHADGYPVKLVRDGTTDVIGEHGTVFYGNLPPSEREPWLRRKLIEEVAEYVADPSLGELADVYAVVEGLAYAAGYHVDDLRAMLEADRRGGFLEGRIMLAHHPEFDGPRP